MLDDLNQYRHNRIMVVDDEEFCHASMRAILTKAGIECDKQVDFCISGREAISQLKKATRVGLKYRLVLTDFNMPELDGIQATKQMRDYLENHMVPKKDQPSIIGATGHIEDKFIELGINAGMNEVISKPIYYAQMLSILQKNDLDVS